MVMAFSTPEIQSGRAPASIPLQLSDFSYTPKYCEENVYMLCKRLCSAGVATPEGSDLFVVFISNTNRQIPLWHQKASSEVEGLIIWDYHVICVQKCMGKDVQVQVWDLDTMLPFPVPLYQYINEAIRPWFPLNPKVRRLFRVVHAPIFLRFFASDRRHMKDAEGNWVAPPPLHSCITAEDGTVHNLDAFISICEEHVKSKLEEAREDLFQIQTGVVIYESMLDEFFTSIL